MRKAESLAGIGIINNPHSRQNRRFPDRMESLGYIVGTQGESVATRRVADINQMARLFKEREVDILGINGGDGSNHLTLTAFIQEYRDTPLPKIAFLRGGTMNTISNACGIKGTQTGLLMNLTDKYRKNIPFETTFRDTIKIDGRYGFIFGNGLICNFLEAYYRQGNTSPWSAFRMFNRVIASALTRGSLVRKMFEPIRARVTVDGMKWERCAYTAIAASTIHEIGLGFKPFFRCEERPGTFHILGFIAKPAGLVLALPKFRMGSKISSKKVRESIAKHAVIESDRVWKYTLDGDIHKADRKLELSLGPRLEIIVK